MRAYIIRRILLMIPTLFIASLIVFFAVRLIPGDIVDVMMAEVQTVSVVDKSALMKELGIDVPLIQQYGRWIGVWPQEDGRISGLLQGNFGKSLRKRSPVIDDILDRLPITVELSLLGMIFAQFIAFPVGIISGLRQDTWIDYVARSFAIICIAVPGFWIGTMVIVFPSIWWGYTPPIVYVSFLENPVENLQMFVMPAIVLGMALSGTQMRLVRSQILEVLRQDYIRTAWAKGLRERAVVLRHVLKAALIPVVTIVGLNLAFLLGGTVIIEQIFNLPGMGGLIMAAARKRDYTVITGVMLFFGVGMVVINLLVDITYGFLDPRIRLK
jgi:peptide/nickel transport system permease protein